jgi:hypothetical protein
MNSYNPITLLPIYRMRLNPHHVFHWMCHTLGIYLVEGKYGRFLRFPNCIHLHYTFAYDPVKINTIFISYMFSVIQSCIQQQIQTEKCICSICDLYIRPHSDASKMHLQQYMQHYMKQYLVFLNRQGRTYSDPLFLHQDFGLSNQKPEGILYPSPYPIYTLSVQ